MRLILEQGKQTLVLFNDPESKAERNVMIRAGEYRDPHHVINYHIALIELLTACCMGRIYEAEIKGAKRQMCCGVVILFSPPFHVSPVPLLSLDEILQQLSDPVNLWAIKLRAHPFLLSPLTCCFQ